MSGRTEKYSPKLIIFELLAVQAHKDVVSETLEVGRSSGESTRARGDFV